MPSIKCDTLVLPLTQTQTYEQKTAKYPKLLDYYTLCHRLC